MQLKHLKSIVPVQENEARITAMAWAPNNLKLAVCTADRVVLLFDETGNKRDKFPTKPADSKYGKKSYVVKGLAFSPDSTKIAVGQSDNIVFVYKVGEDWGDKKVISNKFPQQSAVTCLVWLSEGPIVIGTADGKVKAANIKSNKAHTLYATNSYVVAIAANSQGTGFISGHADGSIVRYYVSQDAAVEQQGRVAFHSVPPYALAWPAGFVIAGGCDKRVIVYNKDGQISQQFDHSKDDSEREFTVACTSPSGQAVCVGSFDRLRILAWSPRKGSWEEESTKMIPNLYTVTSLAWKRDGSRVVCGSLCGAVEMFDSVLSRKTDLAFHLYAIRASIQIRGGRNSFFGCGNAYYRMTLASHGIPLRLPSVSVGKTKVPSLQDLDVKAMLNNSIDKKLSPFPTPKIRSLWKNKFEMTYVGPSQVLVKTIDTGRGVVLKSQFGYEIDDVRIMGHDNYLVARTPQTLLLGDLERNLLSEVVWSDTGRNERFYFDNPTVCLIFNAGELTLVEYGNNVILGSVRTEFMNPHLLSVRLNERQVKGGQESKMLAFLLDLKTVCIVDLISGVTLSQITHDSKIDWLELNETGQKLLFRDKKMRLTLRDIPSGFQSFILSYCTFVQWVPESDVVVAQSRSNLCVWYNIDRPDGVTLIPIKGEVTDVVRANGKTEVMFQDGHMQLSYELDEGLVEFCTAMHDNDFGRAVQYLERLSDQTLAEGMWQNLATLALSQNRLHVAERCYSALGDVSRSHFLRETIRIAEKYQKDTGQDWETCPDLWARLAILDNNLKTAETIYIERNQPEKAIAMYQQLHKWDQAFALAELKGEGGVEQLARERFAWLMDSGQFEQAGHVKEQQGEFLEAFNLYLKAGLPARASRLLMSHPDLLADNDLVTRVTSALLRSELYEQAGVFFEKIDQPEKALDCYRRGHAYARAVDLSRTISPGEVVLLEEMWGDHLVSMQQLDAAINHFIEAGKTAKALDAAVGAKQWKKAEQILEVIKENDVVEKYAAILAQHFISAKDYSTAEKLLTRAGLYEEAVQMYNKAGLWEKAHSLAVSHLDAGKVSNMYVSQASALQAQGKLREAEKLYVSVGQSDAAIAMYRQYRQYDHMIRLVNQHHPDLVQTTHLHLARELEAENSFRAAEQHFLAAEEWKAAISMYRSAEMWEDAYRVANSNGGATAATQVAFVWSKTLGGDSAVKLLTKLGQLEACIQYACETYQFDFAFELARLGMKSQLPEIHCKYAMALEDDGKFRQAEEEFIKANKPKEAILMYIHNQDWDNAARVAEKFDPEGIQEVLVGQAKQAFSSGNVHRFESLMLRAHKPELIIKQYQESDMWVDALRVCREYLPTQLAQLQAEYERNMSLSSRDTATLLAQARQWEHDGEFKTAVDCLITASQGINDDAQRERILTEAAELVNKFLEGDQAVAAVRVLAPRLIEAKQPTMAAQLYLSVEMIRPAIETLVQAGEWSKAKKIAQRFDPSLEAYIKAEERASLKAQGNADQLVDVDVAGALELMASRGDWDRCFQVASTHGPALLHKYVAMRVYQLIKEGNTIDALMIYGTYEAPAFPQNFNLYRRISLDIFSMKNMDTPDVYNTWKMLRNMLFGLTEKMRGSPEDGSAVHKEFDTLLLISHYYSTRAACRETQGLDGLFLKLSLSLLRHSDKIPADKAFYEAGVALRAAGRAGEAFVFLNHYLDVCEAIEDGNTDLLDTTDLACTDCPSDISLPGSMYLPPAQHDEIKEWVLAASVDQQLQQVLPFDSRGLYESALKPMDSTDLGATPCVVSGFPVLGLGTTPGGRGSQPIQFRRHGFYANREDWNTLLMAVKISGRAGPCLTDVIQFITEWTGGTVGNNGASTGPSFSFN